jgi:hemin uptake protein HemP
MAFPSDSRADDPRPTVATSVASRGERRVTSAELVGERGELVILHEGREYRLRVTRNGKLILTA